MNCLEAATWIEIDLFSFRSGLREVRGTSRYGDRSSVEWDFFPKPVDLKEF